MEEVFDFIGPTVLAKKLGMAPCSMTQIRSKGRFPVGRCAAIEIIIEGYRTREQMRPDHFGELDYNRDPQTISRF